MSSSESKSLAGDILWGVPAIATFIDRDERQVYYQLQQGYLPGRKVGHIWQSTRSALRQHLSPVAPEAA